MVELVSRQDQHFKRINTSLTECETFLLETKDDLQSYRITCDMKSVEELNNINVLSKLVRNADGTSDFETIREGMIDPIDPLLLSKESIVYRVPKVLWMPVCLNSDGASSVPGTLILTNYRLCFCPYTTATGSGGHLADDMLTRNRHRRRMSARAGTQKYGKLVDINEYKLRQRNLLYKRVSSLSSMCNMNGNIVIKRKPSTRKGIGSFSIVKNGKTDEEEEGRNGGDGNSDGVEMHMEGSSPLDDDDDDDIVPPDYSPVFEEFDDAPNSFHLPVTSVSRIDCVSEERHLLAVWTESLQSFMLDVSNSGFTPDGKFYNER